MLDQDFAVHPQFFRQGEDSNLERFVLGQLFGQRIPRCWKDEGHAASRETSRAKRRSNRLCPGRFIIQRPEREVQILDW